MFLSTSVPGAKLPPALGAAIAGILDHLPGASLLLNPTINSYKRLVPGFFAPVNVSWGLENRSAAVPAIPSGRAERIRIARRHPGPDPNRDPSLGALFPSAPSGISRGSSVRASGLGQ